MALGQIGRGINKAVTAADATAELARRAESGDAVANQLLAEVVQGQRISTRLPYAKTQTEDPILNNLIINREAMERTPASFKTNTDFLRQYPTMQSKARTPAGIADAFTAEAVDNLIWLYNQAPDAIKNVGKNWYVGANRIAQELAREYGVSLESASGVLASLSPQKDWYQNVSLAERVLDTYKKVQNKIIDDDVYETAKRLYSQPAHAEDLKTLQDIPFEQMNNNQKAIVIRSYDQTYNDRGYQLVNPNGDRVGQAFTEKGDAAKTAWGSNVEIGKAIKVIEDPSIENISNQMGSAHKVRNFYNNIANPTYAIDNPSLGDITIDTHAVAADQLRPFSGSSEPVGAAFGSQKGVSSSAETGAKGTYGLHADAYRIAAQELGIQPRELQSVTWETVRSLYSPAYKNKISRQIKSGDVDEITEIWNLYKTGKINKGMARELILDKAGGIPDPDWANGPSSGIPNSERPAANIGKLPISGVSGKSQPRGFDAGRKLLAAGVPVGFLTTLGISPESEASVGSATRQGIKAFHGTQVEFEPARLLLDKQTGKELVVPQKSEIHRKIVEQNPDRYEVLKEAPLGQFDLEKIGRGEGAQAFGWGLYFAENPKVSRGYRSSLLGQHGIEDTIKIGDKSLLDVYNSLVNAEAKGDPTAWEKIDVLEKLEFGGDVLAVDEVLPELGFSQSTIDWYQNEVKPNFKRKGALYEVNLDTSPEKLIDYDVEFDKQPKAVQDFFLKYREPLEDWIVNNSNMNPDITDMDGEYLYNLLSAALRDDFIEIPDELDRILEYAGSDEVASRFLNQHGVDGIKYLDRQSRRKGEGYSNYVIFNQQVIDIANKYGVTLPVAAAIAGGMSPEEAMAQEEAFDPSQPSGIRVGEDKQEQEVYAPKTAAEEFYNMQNAFSDSISPVELSDDPEYFDVSQYQNPERSGLGFFKGLADTVGPMVVGGASDIAGFGGDVVSIYNGLMSGIVNYGSEDGFWSSFLQGMQQKPNLLPLPEDISSQVPYGMQVPFGTLPEEDLKKVQLMGSFANPVNPF